MDKKKILSDYFLNDLTIKEACYKYELSEYELNKLVFEEGASFLKETLGVETIKNILQVHISYSNRTRAYIPLSKKLDLPHKTITHIYNKFKSIYLTDEIEPLITKRCTSCGQLFQGKLGDVHEC